MNKKENFFESLFFGSLLTMIAGSIDSYTYLTHGEVFAGLQTGNLILLGTNLGLNNLFMLNKYLVSILAFALGTILIRIFQYWLKNDLEFIRKRLILLFEIVLLIIAYVINDYVPVIASTALISIAASAELQEFKVIKGKPFTPLMMTGNIRKLSENVFDAFKTKDQKFISITIDTLTIIITFIIGATLTGVATIYIKQNSILIPILLLIITEIFTFIFQKNRRIE